MWSTQTFDGQMTGYYGNSLDYQSNLINSGNANIYSNTSSVIKQSSPNLIAHSPISEDETSLKRKRRGQRNSRKVMIEKRRRDRINLSLDELRKLVPAANEKQGSAKLEKAEILQMTVDHLKQLHAKGFDTFSFDPHNFATKHLVFGFKECAEQVNRYLSSIENCGLNNDSRQRLFSHLQHYIAKRECDLKANNSNGLAWNPNLFLIPPTTTNQTNSFSNSTTNSLVNTTSAQQMLNSTTNLSPITTLTPSSLSNHSNSSITSNSSSYHQQVNNQQNDHSTPTSPLSESPVTNNNNNNSSLNGSSLNSSSLNGSSLNTSQLSASQLLSQHSYIDNNNNTSSSSNNSLHSDSSSNNNNSSGQNSNSINDDNGRNSNNLLTNQLSNQLISSQVSSNLSNIMGPPPPLLQKVNVLNGISTHTPNTSELTYTNMHPCSNTTAYGAHHSIGTNAYSTNSLPNSYVAAIQHHSNHIHTPYFNSALAYGTSVGQMSAGASVVANVVSLPNSSVSHSATNQAYSNSAIASYCHRPWRQENMKIAY